MRPIDNNAKDFLKPFLDNYIEMLLDGLVQDKVIKVIDDNKNQKGKTYELVKDVKEKITTDKLPKSATDLIRDFFDFKEIVINVYYHSNFKDSNDARNLPLSHVIQKFEELKVFKLFGDKTRLKDLIDKGERLLDDKEIEEDAIKLFKENKLNFGEYTLKVLKYYLRRKAENIFNEMDFLTSDTSLELPIKKSVELIGNNDNGSNLLIDFKYRKRTFSNVKDSIFQGYELLTRYNNMTGKDNYFILVTFIDEDTGPFEKLEYRFKQNLEELFPNYLKKIFLVPVSVKNMHFIENPFKEIKKLLDQQKFTADNFTFSNQSPPSGRADLDDHYYDKTFNLNKNSYEIRINPIGSIDHWRVGMKFTKDGKFTSNEQRIGGNCPLFHLEKNIDYNGLKVTYYNELGVLVFNKATTLLNYTNEPITIKLSYQNNKVEIEIFNGDQTLIDSNSIIDQAPWFKLFAWGDNRNKFEIKSVIIEKSI